MMELLSRSVKPEIRASFSASRLRTNHGIATVEEPLLTKSRFTVYLLECCRSHMVLLDLLLELGLLFRVQLALFRWELLIFNLR
jgi:hypothetical protein